MAETQTTERYYGFDLIRLVSYFAIIIFHTSLFYYYSPTISYSDVSSIVWAADRVSRIFAFSGFTVVFLSSLLLGQSRAPLRKRNRLFLVILFGWIYLSLLMHDRFFLVWDIYTLLLVSFLLMQAFEHWGKKWVRSAGLLGFGLLWFPIWKFSAQLSTLPDYAAHVLGFAECRGQEINEWPAIPWMGLIWLGYALGRELKELRESDQLARLELRWNETLLWAPILLASIPQWGAYYHIRLGEYFSCDAYRQDPIVFWSHFVWVAWAIRLSVDPRIQHWLGRWTVVRQISNLAISRKYWLAYALHYIWGNAIAGFFELNGPSIKNFKEIYELSITEFLCLTLLLQNELLTRAALWVMARCDVLGKKYFSLAADMIQKKWRVREESSSKSKD